MHFARRVRGRPRTESGNPLGVDGIKLHHWHLDDPKHPVDDAFTRRLLGPRGAYIVGRNMFGPVRGEWGESDWRERCVERKDA